MSSSGSAETKARLKDSSRDGRLSFKNIEEQQLRKELKSIAIEKCRDEVQAFGRCAEKNGLLVVFNCRQLSRDMSGCIARYRSEEEFERYKAKHRPDLVKKKPSS